MKTKLQSVGVAFWVAIVTVLLFGGGCAGDRYNQSTGERIDDVAITSRVRSALNDDTQFKFPRVEVTTFKGTVQLNGFVNSKDQKDRAGELARMVPGVEEVVNNITVRE